jgi:capsular exopolysaccharide synthesis family protein
MSAPPSNPLTGPDTSTLLKALRRRWAAAAVLGCVAAATAGGAAWFLLSPRYTVTAQFLITAAKQQIVPRGSREDRDGSPTTPRTQVAMIKHRDVLNEALKRSEVKNLPIVRDQPEPLLWLGDELAVKFPEGSEIAEISMIGNEPAQLIPLLDGVATAFLEVIVLAERNQRLDELRKSQEAYEKSKDKLRTAYAELNRRSKETGAAKSLVATSMQGVMLSTLTDRQKELGKVQTELRRLRQQVADAEAKAKAVDQLPLPEADIEERIEADLVVKEGLAKRKEILNAIGRYEGVVHEHDTVLRDLRRRLGPVEKALDDRRTELRAQLAERYRKAFRQSLDGEVQRAQDSLTLLGEEEKALTGQIDALKAECARIGSSATQMDSLSTEIEVESNSAKKIGDRMETLQYELEVPPRVSLYQSATVQKKDIKRQVLATAAAPVAAFVGVCLLVGWWEVRGRRIHSADEVVQALGLRLVGAVPPLGEAPAGFGAAAAEGAASGHELLESIDAIRTVLLRHASVADLRAVMVTSATSGEGKTTLAGHLAVSLARAGRRTLLVDCDLRRPAAHQLFEQSLQPGLSEVLLKEIELSGAVRPTTAMENLWLLPAGQWDREVLKALAQEGLRQAFDQLRDQFDFIVVDSSPVLAATDSLLVGQHVDAVILSLLRGVSQVPPVNAAAQRLSSLGIRVLGAVVNGLSPDSLYNKGYVYRRDLAVGVS